MHRCPCCRRCALLHRAGIPCTPVRDCMRLRRQQTAFVLRRAHTHTDAGSLGGAGSVSTSTTLPLLAAASRAAPPRGPTSPDELRRRRGMTTGAAPNPRRVNKLADLEPGKNQEGWRGVGGDQSTLAAPSSCSWPAAEPLPKAEHPRVFDAMSTGRSSLSWEASTSAEASPDESSTVGSLEGALARRGLQKQRLRRKRAAPAHRTRISRGPRVHHAHQVLLGSTVATWRGGGGP